MSQPRDHMTCYRCGCFSDKDGIDHCPTHAAAPEMLVVLQGLLKSADALWESDTACEGHDWALACQTARALLAKTEGRPR